MAGIHAARLLGAALVAIAGASVAGGATIIVETTADTLSAADGLCSLREALLAANGNTAFNDCPAGSGTVQDTIELPAGIYTLAIAGAGEDAALTGDLDITDSLLLQGAGKELTIVDGGGLDRVLHIDPAGDDVSVHLADLTIRNGSLSGDNGGGLANFGSLIAVKVAVTANVTGDDDFGGGIFNDGTLQAFFVEVSGNSGGDGAGIFAEGGSTTQLNFSRVSGNTSSTSAGGINNNGTLQVDYSLIADNTATLFNGGGILNNVTLTIENSTLSGNSAGAAGAAVHNGDTATLVHVTIAENTTVAGGGALFNNGTVNLDHALLADNAGGNCAGAMPFTSQGFNLEDGAGCLLSGPGDMSNTDPQLGPLQNNDGPTATYGLAATSPAVDAGDPADTSGLDQRFASRNADGDGDGTAVRDIGAFELFSPFVVNVFGDGTDAVPGDGLCEVVTGSGLCTVRAAVQEANSLPGWQKIVLPAGTHSLQIPGAGEELGATGDLDVRGDLLIEGAGAGSTVIDGGGLDRVFHLHATTALSPFWVEIARLTVRNGAAELGGCLRTSVPGLYCGLLLRETEITGCSASSSGGGLYLDAPDVYAPLATAVDTAIHGNDGGVLGGAIGGHYESRLLVRRSTLAGNQVTGSGGGISAGVVTLFNSTISGNTADNGGGIFTDNLTTVAHSTVAGNLATSGQAGGLFLVSPVIFHNSILAGNTGDPGMDNCNTGSGTAISRGFNLESSASCSLAAAGDQAGTDPRLIPLADNGGLTRTHMLAASSPAIDAGDGGQCPERDQRGADRPQDGDGVAGAACDKGAVEALDCQPLVLEGFTIDSAVEYAACESITARDLGFEDGSDARLTAGRLLVLNEGVSFASGAVVELAIDAALGASALIPARPGEQPMRGRHRR